MRGVIPIIYEFLDKYYPNCESVILGGSYIEGGFNEYSDFDIVVIDNKAVVSTEKVYLDFGTRFEVNEYSKHSITEQLIREREKGIPVLTGICGLGIVVKGEGIGQGIQQQAQHNAKSGPYSLSAIELSKRITEISSILEAMKKNPNYSARIFLVNLLSIKFPDLILRLNNFWSGKGKRLIRQLEKFDNNLKDMLLDSLCKFYYFNDIQPLEKLLNMYVFNVLDIEPLCVKFSRRKEISLEERRYFITDSIYDLLGSDDFGEQLILINTLSLRLAEFILRSQNIWDNDELKIHQILKRFNEGLYLEFTESLEMAYVQKRFTKLINFTDAFLLSYGGRYF